MYVYTMRSLIERDLVNTTFLKIENLQIAWMDFQNRSFFQFNNDKKNQFQVVFYLINLIRNFRKCRSRTQ